MNNCLIHGKPIVNSAGCLDCQSHGGYMPHAKTPYKCPYCDGAGIVSRPPHVAGDIATWSSAGTETYPCNACKGSGVIWHE